MGEFYDERRVVVPYHRIPKKLVQAFIASEDAGSSTTAAQLHGLVCAASTRPT